MITVIQIRKQTQSKTIEAKREVVDKKKVKVCTTKNSKGKQPKRIRRAQWGLVVCVKVSAGPR